MASNVTTTLTTALHSLYSTFIEPYPHLYTTVLNTPQTLFSILVARAFDYASTHPYQTAYQILSILLTPILGSGWMLKKILLPWLGFGRLGVIAGSVAAWYQATRLGGYIPAGSLFAALQRLAMR